MKKREEKLKEKMQLPTKNNNSLMHNDFQQDNMHKNKRECYKKKEYEAKKALIQEKESLRSKHFSKKHGE